MRGRILFMILLMMTILVSLSVPAAGSSSQAADLALSASYGRPTNQLMIKFSSLSNEVAMLADGGANVLAGLSQAAGEDLAYVRPMSGGAHVLALAEQRPAAEVVTISARLAELPEIEYAEPDRFKGIHRPVLSAPDPANLNPNDTRFDEQWHYGYTPGTAEGLNLPPAWAISGGSADTVVAVIDTGILNHPDLAGKILPGYDFISDLSSANDGDRWDDDPSDPGDWVAANECGFHPSYSSSWHGTHVAGTIGAVSNNGLGVAGVNWQAKILPVRVLGKCGGTTSDIIDAIRWSAGLAVPGAPVNANPAGVINLSLGGQGTCSPFEQEAFDDVVAAGTTVVIAAGNDGDNAAGFSPANCNNTITVAATEREGDRAYYSNYGSIIEVSAPGGETIWQAANGILSTLNSGATVPGDHIYAFYQGTSMAAPHVAGLASLALGLDPTLTPAQVSGVLQASARAFPAGSSCTTSNCGAGIVDAFNTLMFVQRPELGNDTFLPLIAKTVEPAEKSLKNGDFEAQRTGWTEFSTHNYILILEKTYLPVMPHSGDWAAWLGWGYGETSTIEQTVHIAAGTPHLTYWHWIDSDDYGCGNDYAVIVINGSIVADLYNVCVADNTYGWVKRSTDLSAWAGQTVALQIRIETDDADGSDLEPGHRSNLYVDDVAFLASAVPAGQSDQPGPDRPALLGRERRAPETSDR